MSALAERLFALTTWQSIYGKISPPGGMAERLKATVLKTVVVQATVGSNPTPSAGHGRLTSGRLHYTIAQE